ncbi:restriction endonuclease subunit S, partial [Thermocrinis sp.]|uniref:restriction endonuclease subunit S n=1 Tax=Thermocrinis sp. TaxID=2024383 RepID=UPI002FDD63C9
MFKFRWETEFKETEIGEIPKDWEVSSLKNILKSLESGNRPKGGVLAHNPFGILSIGGENINWDGSLELENCLRFEESFYTSLKKGKIEDGDILLVKDGTIGKIAFISKIPEGKAMVNEHVFLLKTDPTKFNSRFLFYFLFSKIGQQQIESSISGSAQGGINKSIQDNILVFYPPLPEQSRIATVLSWFDDLIENKKKQNEILEKTAMAIFKSWFIDFEPFKDGEFVYNEELGREIPKGWEVKRLGEVVKTFKGISYKGSEKYQDYIEGAYIFITLDNFLRGGGFKNEYTWIKSEKIKTLHLVKEGDIIIALTDMTQDGQVVGAPAIVILPNNFNVGVISLDCMKLEPTLQELKYYLYLFLKDTQEENATFANGANVLHLMVNNFLGGKLFPIPPFPILQSFHSLVEPLFQKIILNQKQIITL